MVPEYTRVTADIRATDHSYRKVVLQSALPHRDVLPLLGFVHGYRARVLVQ